MGVGFNIRNIRILRGMTQKELGMKAGFSASTADVRIRQYESEKMVPKEDKLKAIAKALDVDVCAFTDHAITSDCDIMHIFFELENNFGLKVGKDNTGKTILYFDEADTLGRFHDINLDNWYRTKLSFTSTPEDTDYEEKQKQYELWKRRYPLDMYEAENAVQHSVTEKYKDLLYSIKTHFKIKYVTEFITIFQKLVKNGYDIKITHSPERSGIGKFVCCATFKSQQLLEAKEEAAIAYAEYLAITYQLEGLGIEIERNYSTEFGEIVSNTYFYNSTLSTALIKVICEMITQYKNGNFSDELYQIDYQDSLQIFNIPIEDL